MQKNSRKKFGAFTEKSSKTEFISLNYDVNIHVYSTPKFVPS